MNINDASFPPLSTVPFSEIAAGEVFRIDANYLVKGADNVSAWNLSTSGIFSPSATEPVERVSATLIIDHP